MAGSVKLNATEVVVSRDVEEFSVVMKEGSLEILPKELVFVVLTQHRFGVFVKV